MAETDSPTSKNICTVFPAHKSNFPPLKLSVFDLTLLSFPYIRRGGLFHTPPFPIPELISRLKTSLSHALTYFPPLAGRLTTDSDGYLYITCNDAGVDFIHAHSSDICMSQFLVPSVPDEIRSRCYSYDGVPSYEGNCRPLLAVQVTELADGVFIGCFMSHGIVDGTSYWHFFNCFAELSRGLKTISMLPDFSRDLIPVTSAMPKVPPDRVATTVRNDTPISQRIFSFSGESIRKLKAKVNGQLGETASSNLTIEISSFQSLCALLWRTITRARKLSPSTTTAVMLAVNVRHRLEPKLDAIYFGNAAQSIPTYADAGDIVGRDLWWCAKQLNKTVVAHDNALVRKYVEIWERKPSCSQMYLLENFKGPLIVIGESPKFPMYNTDFGWGRPVAIKSASMSKFDGVILAYPGREGKGSVDLEVSLAEEVMAILESDPEFVPFVSSH